MRLVRMGGLSALAAIVILAWPALSPGAALADETPPLSLAEMEDAFIAAVEADGGTLQNRRYEENEKPYYGEILRQRLGCFRSDASGNIDRGWTLLENFWQLQSVRQEGYAYEGRFLVLHGFRFRSATEKSALILDRVTRRVVPVMLHYFDWIKLPGRHSEWRPDGIVSAFLPPDLPSSVVTDLDRVIADWIARLSSRYFDKCKAHGSCTPRYHAFTCE